MKYSLVDLDELLNNLHSSYTKEYVAEVLAAYRSGAYRAAVATIWVAICIDIIEKIRELSNLGEKYAEKIIAELDSIGQDDKVKIQKFESQLIEHAASEEFQLITLIEKDHLKRIYLDRNICVHPTFQKDGRHFEINSELVRSHIIQASNILFLNPPRVGKSSIKRIWDLINEKSFPEDSEQAFHLLSSSYYLGKSKDAVYRDLLLIVLKRFFADKDAISVPLGERMCIAVNVLYKLKPSIVLTVFGERFTELLAMADEVILKRVFILLRFLHFPWSHISSPIKTRIKNLILTLSAEDIIKYKIHESVRNISDLAINLRERIVSLEASDKLMVLAGSPSSDFKDLAIETFINSGSFGSAYENGKKYLLPHAVHFNQEDLNKVLQGSLNNKAWKSINQILNAGGMEEILCELYSKSKRNISQDKFTKEWADFWNYLAKEGFDKSYEDLAKKLAADRIIEANSNIIEEDDEIPF